MESECFLSCSQNTATGPYPEPDASSSHLNILFLLRSISIQCTHLRLGPTHPLLRVSINVTPVTLKAGCVIGILCRYLCISKRVMPIPNWLYVF